MRCLKKGPIPSILAENHDQWLTAYLEKPASDTHKYRYRSKDIKDALRDETGWKCVYCESKIGHNTPGDVEHKVPTSRDPNLHFSWSNLTVACTECNRRKLDYYEKGSEFLDPYSDPVEDWLLHIGPFVYWKPGVARAEVTVRKLALDNWERAQLLQRKCDALEKARALAQLVTECAEDSLAELRRDELRRMQNCDAEFSSTIRAYIEGHPGALPSRNVAG